MQIRFPKITEKYRSGLQAKRSRPNLSFWTIFGQKIELKKKLNKQIDAKTQLSSSNLRQTHLSSRKLSSILNCSAPKRAL